MYVCRRPNEAQFLDAATGKIDLRPAAAEQQTYQVDMARANRAAS
jgi:hypothetical protein